MMKKLLSQISKPTLNYIIYGFIGLVLTILLLMHLWDIGVFHRINDVLAIVSFIGPFGKLFLIGIIPVSISLALLLTGIVLAYSELR